MQRDLVVVILHNSICKQLLWFYVLPAMCYLHATIHPPTTIYKWRQNYSQYW